MKALFVYGLIVVSLILVSLFFRVFSIIKESSFDGQHRFTLVVGEGKKAFGVISFEPQSSSISFLTFSNGSSIPFSEFNRKVGIITDGYIKTNRALDLHDGVSSLLLSFIFNNNSLEKNVTIYDLIRFYWFASTTSVGNISTQEMAVSADSEEFDKKVSLLFRDNFLSQENVSIQIVNASGESGLAGRLERVITNMGGNVVSIKNAMTSEAVSKIQYSGGETYTLGKLQSFLSRHSEVLNGQAMAEIVIILGKDIKNTSLF